MARYAIGRLYRPPKIDNGENLSANAGEDESKETIGGLVPINFIAVATPHLGSRGNKQVISCLFVRTWKINLVECNMCIWLN